MSIITAMKELSKFFCGKQYYTSFKDKDGKLSFSQWTGLLSISLAGLSVLHNKWCLTFSD